MNPLERIDEVTRPIHIGETFLVPCIVDDCGVGTSIYPVHNYPHNDIENGQPNIHYHGDTRFYETVPMGVNLRHELTDTCTLEYRQMKLYRLEEEYKTHTVFIRNSKLKQKCIHKGKCPHRGYDLSNVVPVNGKITCPMHSLVFDATTGKITDECLHSMKEIRIREKQQIEENTQLIIALRKIPHMGTISAKQFKEEIDGKHQNCFTIMAEPHGKYGEGMAYTYIQSSTNEWHPKPIKNGFSKTFFVMP